MPKILSISGSLRAESSNSELLGAAEILAPEGVRIVRYAGLGELPHFNPDLLGPDGSEPLPPAVAELDALIGEADGVLISCPEYARGIPGSFKNMLDWLVGSHRFPYKPVALFNASPRASHAQEALKLVLTTMSATLVEEAFITVPLLAKGLMAQEIAAHPELAPIVSHALEAFSAAVRQAETV
ncbi:NADPH-dependent FMN reductase [Aestuariispira ectoiniformans]|uniref:NADPH-dependent FMN reductase n=1 Tax=Aestuariispira ectoiniformans TaxID=2775080 RepID=UPI00223C02BB|nr:NADPH-dependent FMN reductase [Aestuariispira ectoiniformans]